jgi:hypothetical protein
LYNYVIKCGSINKRHISTASQKDRRDAAKKKEKGKKFSHKGKSGEVVSNPILHTSPKDRRDAANK